jgi:hypothetical protein
MGAATLACAREIERLGGRIVAIGALLVRSPGPADDWPEGGLPVASLVGLSWNVWPPDACPLCRSGVPLDPTD